MKYGEACEHFQKLCPDGHQLRLLHEPEQNVTYFQALPDDPLRTRSEAAPLLGYYCWLEKAVHEYPKKS